MQSLNQENRVRFQHHRASLFAVCAVVMAAATIATPLRAAAPITDFVPADALVMYTAKPYEFLGEPPQSGDAPAATQPEARPNVSLTTIVSFLNAMGLIPSEGQVYADIVAALPLFGRFEHAVILLDASTEEVESKDSAGEASSSGPILRLGKLQMALVFRTGDNARSVAEQINRVLQRYTNRNVARLSREKVGDHEYQRLTDDRMKDWAIWEWGKVGEFFIIGFGDGAFKKVLATGIGKLPAMSGDKWYQEASGKTRVQTGLAHWFIAFRRLRNQLGDAAEGRVARVTAALQADHLTHDLWCVGQEGRSLAVRRCYRHGETDTVRLYSDPQQFDPVHSAVVPPSARRVAILTVPTRWLVDNLPQAWLASQSEGNIRKWKVAWDRLETEKGIDISRHLIDNVGNTVILCDYPPHPLRIPFALTVAIEISNPRAVRAATDAMLDAWRQYLDDRAERNMTVLVRVYVRRDEDGVWYLQAGILGPAMKVTDRYLVISWSPQALRDALRYFEKTPTADAR